jgi:hypothetical protein
MGLAEEVEHTGKMRSIAPQNILLLRVIVKLGSTCEVAPMNHYVRLQVGGELPVFPLQHNKLLSRSTSSARKLTFR